MLLRTFARRALTTLALGAVCAGAASAQLTSPSCVSWDSTAYDTTGNLFVEGFLVAQEGAAGVEVFSASARKFQLVSPPGSGVVDSGDWCLTIKENTTIRAYSARLNNSAALPASVQPVDVRGHDDVAVVIGFDTFTSSFTAWGYSAVRGLWEPQALGGQVGPADVEISRFVVGVRDGNDYHGFSARTGKWRTFSGPNGALLRADGNTLLADFTATGAGGFVAAFSGVRGCWSPSPPVANPSPVLLDHNTAYIRVQATTPGAFRGCGYSAYRAAWVSSPFAQSFASVLEIITDNVVLIDNSIAGIGLDAFSAGGAAWEPMPGPFRPLVVDEDYAIASGPTPEVWGFSGLCAGPWVPQPFAPTAIGVLPVVPPDHIGGVDTGSALHVWLPASNSWAPTLAKSPGDVVLAADAVIECVTLGGVRAIATRWGNWVSNPPVSLTTAGTGSVIAHQAVGGVIESFDERCDMWNAPNALGAPTLMTAGRNLVVFSPLAGSAVSVVRAYSVQRGDWTSPGAIPTPLAVGPIAEENVAALVDGGGTLWAYGSPNDGHVYYQWPNGTEYHVSGGVFSTATCKPTLFDYGIRANPGDLSWMLLGPTIQCPPLSVAGYGGSLWLPLIGTSVYGFVGVHDVDCMVDQKIPLATPTAACIQPWFQALTLDMATFTVSFSCRRSDAAWIF